MPDLTFTDYEEAVAQDGHSMHHLHACMACGDIDGCHLPAKVRAVLHYPTRPKVVCLCGSTRFYEEFQKANYIETMAGRIVLSVGFYPHAELVAHGSAVGCTAEQKTALDELHKRKIDLADEVLVLNVGGYIGDSTRSEIAYAIACKKPVRYIEP